jgi:hypothetical protein
MNLSMPGTNISAVEITHISSHGVWLLANGRELFMSYDDFPWFKDVPVGKILNVEQPMPGHFYWPDLDVDLSEEIITHPERFPLKAK